MTGKFSETLCRLCLLLLLMIGAAGSRVGAQVPENPDEDYVIASVMIASPGGALYSKLGHAFLRMQCPSHDMDFCFSYESEGVPGKVGRFLAGNLMMGMGALPTEEFLAPYRREGREVREYVLNLPIAVKQNIWRILDGKVEQGMLLPYDYMERGCALSTFRIIEEAAGRNHLSYGQWPSDFEMTRREIVCSQLDDSPWTKVFLNIITNGPIDDDVVVTERVITPRSLEQTLRIAHYDGRPLISGSATEVLPLEAEAERRPAVTPIMVALALLMAALVTAIFGKTWMLLPLALVQALLGCFVAYLLFFSSLCATESSWLIVPFNPLPIIFWKWRRLWELPVTVVMLVWAAAITFGGDYLMDPPLTVLACAIAVAYAGDTARRRGWYIKISNYKLYSNKLKPIQL